MKVITRTFYVTSDGAEHVSAENATIHETALRVKKAIEDATGRHPRFDTCRAIVRNWVVIKAAVEAPHASCADMPLGRPAGASRKDGRMTLKDLADQIGAEQEAWPDENECL